MVPITQHILAIRRIKTTLSENKDNPVFSLKSGLNETKFDLSDNENHQLTDKVVPIVQQNLAIRAIRTTVSGQMVQL